MIMYEYSVASWIATASGVNSRFDAGDAEQ